MNRARLSKPSLLLGRWPEGGGKRLRRAELLHAQESRGSIRLSFAITGNNSHPTMDPPLWNPLTSPPERKHDEIDKEHDVVDEEPQAELCAVGKRCISAQTLDSVSALSHWLREHLPPGSCQQISEWGKLPGTKRVANLWLELSQGEISLEDSIPPIRTVHVACVKIINESGKMLLEACQEMADGSIRERNRPLSEKMKPGESVEDACLRGIREELGSDYGSGECVKMLQHSYKREVQERESFSYPGLMTCYVLHHMVAVMKDLPTDDFFTEENELSGNAQGEHTLPVGMGESLIQAKDTCLLGPDESAVGVKRHFWKWVPDDTPKSAW
eukprot:c28968_g1_i1 orf=162-1148(+)